MPLKEFEYIKWIRKYIGPSKHAVVGSGDDCAALKPGRGNLVLISTDMLLEGAHFTLDAGAERIGRKTVAVSLSDAAAMGVRPAALVATVAFHRPMRKAFAQGLIRGMAAVAAEFGAEIVGGDITSWKGPLALSSTVLCFAPKNGLVLRSTARAGDLVYVTGKLGGSILGRQYTFTPRVEEGVYLARRRFATSMMDVSDGLAMDIRNLADASGRGAVVYADRVPVSADAKKLSLRDGISPLIHAYGDGEDFELLFTVSKRRAAELEKKWPFKTQLTRVGEITAGRDVWLVFKDGRREPLSKYGYEHEIG
jgi:thiamine-monophosphate kinase